MTAELTVDREGIVTAWSAEAEQLLGYPASQAIGRAMDFFIPEEERAGPWAGFRRAMETGLLHYGPSDILDVEMINSGGGRVPLDVTIAPQRDAQGRIIAITAMLRTRM
ncbi:MAG: PAS domain-containing protein [Pseudorhodoplanes sp.]